MACDEFLSTLSLRRATCPICQWRRSLKIFLSTLSLRRATPGAQIAAKIEIFLSTLSLRRATPPRHRHGRQLGDFYPRSPCGERRHARVGVAAGAVISIHALLAESDLYFRFSTYRLNISIHALLAESDRVLIPRPGRKKYFYPRSPCGERPGWRKDWQQYYSISIHALLAESDTVALPSASKSRRFLSTLSLRRATR